MKFYTEISEDERADWRKFEATELAMEMLAERAAELEQEALSLMRAAEFTKANHKAGQADGFREALSLLEHDR